MKSKQLLLSLVMMLLCFLVKAQSNDITEQEQKDLNKAYKLFDKKKYDDAIALYEPVVMNHRKNTTLWTNLCMIYYQKYLDAPSPMSIRATGKDKELAKALETLLNGFGIKPAEYYDYINIMRKATLQCPDLERVGSMIRAELIDSRYPVDTGVTEKAKKYFKTAEDYLSQKDFNNAVKNYRKALNEYPDYFKAYLYLGDAYYLNNDYERAEMIFESCSDSFPDLIEPVKYYFDALYRQEDYSKAYEVCLRGLMVCPDIGMQLKFDEVCGKLGKSYKQHWISRNHFPNRPDGKNEEVEDGVWKYYVEAAGKVKQYTDTVTGIIRPNPITKIVYLEEYCWNEMLDKADPSKFEFARKMRDKGMLDCYVLFSLFHVDVYTQFHHLSVNNKEKLKRYIEEELIIKR